MNIGISCSICSASEEASEATPLLLDTYTGAQTAFSFNFKLRTEYSGSAFRVRRDNDNAELDIGFSGTDVAESALTTFVGANSAYVVTAYDQSSNGNDWTQSTAGLQPRIVSAGTVDKINGKIAIYSDPAVQTANINCTITGAVETTAFHVLFNSTAWLSINIGGTNAVYYGLMTNGTLTDNYNSSGTPDTYVNGSIIGDSQDALYDAVLNIQSIASFTGLDLSNVSWDGFNTDYIYSSAVGAPTYIQETIIYDSDKSSDRAAIETDINNRYSIY